LALKLACFCKATTQVTVIRGLGAVELIALLGGNETKIHISSTDSFIRKSSHLYESPMHYSLAVVVAEIG